MKLSGRQLERLSNAFLDAFDRSELERLLRFEFDVRLDNVARWDSTMRTVVYDILSRSEMEGWTQQLLEATHKARPHNQAIEMVYREMAGKAGPVAEPVEAAAGKIEPPLFM